MALAWLNIQILTNTSQRLLRMSVHFTPKTDILRMERLYQHAIVNAKCDVIRREVR